MGGPEGRRAGTAGREWTGQVRAGPRAAPPALARAGGSPVPAGRPCAPSVFSRARAVVFVLTHRPGTRSPLPRDAESRRGLRAPPSFPPPAPRGGPQRQAPTGTDA